jgi:hypothetical protein
LLAHTFNLQTYAYYLKIRIKFEVEKLGLFFINIIKNYFRCHHVPLCPLQFVENVLLSRKGSLR